MWLIPVAQHLYPSFFYTTHIHIYTKRERKKKSYMHSISADALMKDHFAIRAVTTIATHNTNYFFLKTPILLLQPHFVIMSEAKNYRFLFRKIVFFFFLLCKEVILWRVHHPEWHINTYFFLYISTISFSNTYS